ncbi:hypothetical protein BDV95DRAFT_189025 [Massariosphaeria phaeospora]|uniref:Uncharacterized protein n=1 Tax=Massariosphaeria phaeospora TaxID=100035 RepID=A0A7C8M1P3_9PLEO|nr:hypothetical protein BDV95DRAFT_189025 [Massariosphaeria phaeospora]
MPMRELFPSLQIGLGVELVELDEKGVVVADCILSDFSSLVHLPILSPSKSMQPSSGRSSLMAGSSSDGGFIASQRRIGGRFGGPNCGKMIGTIVGFESPDRVVVIHPSDFHCTAPATSVSNDAPEGRLVIVVVAVVLLCAKEVEEDEAMPVVIIALGIGVPEFDKERSTEIDEELFATAVGPCGKGLGMTISVTGPLPFELVLNEELVFDAVCADGVWNIRRGYCYVCTFRGQEDI